jgi:hypothetical protein
MGRSPSLEDRVRRRRQPIALGGAGPMVIETS